MNGSNFTRKSLDGRLARYALAGTALLAVPGAAHAGIMSSGVVNLSVTPGTPLPIDFDQTGGADFTLNVSNGGTKRIWIEGTGATRFNLGPLSYGTAINIGNTTVSGVNDLFKDGFSQPWNNTTHGFIGVRFTTSGQQYLGWAELTLDGTTPSATVNSYAYNNVANASINAGEVPEPSSLALFAAGAAGLAILRRRRKAA